VARFVIRLARRAGIVALFVLSAIGGTLCGLLFAYSDDLPQITALDDYAPSTITRLKSSSATTRSRYRCGRRSWLPRMPGSTAISA
jgi:membrane carboxypeptidase/penicillin-binding protein